jgi:hypothetical protein
MNSISNSWDKIALAWRFYRSVAVFPSHTVLIDQEAKLTATWGGCNPHYRVLSSAISEQNLFAKSLVSWHTRASPFPDVSQGKGSVAGLSTSLYNLTFLNLVFHINTASLKPTPQSRSLEKLTVAQLVKTSPACYGTHGPGKFECHMLFFLYGEELLSPSTSCPMGTGG